MIKRFFTLCFLLLPFLFSAQASEELPLPRFVSVKSSEANVRTGPGKRYPIKWEITRKDTPVEVLSEFEQWRKIRDITGDEGWIHQGMLSGARFVVVQAAKPLILRRSDSASSRPVARLENGVSSRLKTCTSEWCEVDVNGVSGWLPRSSLWGVYSNETFRR